MTSHGTPPITYLELRTRSVSKLVVGSGGSASLRSAASSLVTGVASGGCA